MNRRAVVQSVAGLLTGVTAGCSAVSDTEPTTSSTEVATGASGNEAPWAREGNPADIVVQNRLSTEIAVTLTLSDRRRELQVPAKDRWISDDIVPDGESPDVRIQTDAGHDTTVEWLAEEDNLHLLYVQVKEDQLVTDFSSKDDDVHLGTTTSG
ncbi:hypothetical protein [Haloarchaeobius sp. DFWS5]|uniref:hypothetical protein n=1 Tax=Haloarchaeobius sp. DFWS5 TaxID=3446114 RepID=UPI003EBE7C70